VDETRFAQFQTQFDQLSTHVEHMPQSIFRGFQAQFELMCDGITEIHEDKFRKFQAQFQLVSTGITQRRETATAAERKIARQFNSFRLFAIASNEVRTHSAILAELLNPSGRHAQGALFLQGFVDICRAKNPDFPLLPAGFQNQKWVIEKEKITPLGYLDIIVACPTLRYRFAIENKIYAAEQPRQLQRYAQWLGWGARIYTAQALIFLTPSGRSAVNAEQAKYFRLSYREDVYEWLQATLPLVAAPRVRETIAQYLEIVEDL
jgi:hypothetical protein